MSAALIAVAMLQSAAGGAIFDVAQPYVPLTSGQRAARVGDVITIVLAERTQGESSSGGAANHSGSIGLIPPTTGPLALFGASDATASGSNRFDGRGSSAQSNALSGEVSATIVEVLPNGTLRLSGEKRLRINRGDETVIVSGLARLADVGEDNRILSTRLADARIDYRGRGEVARASRQGWLQRFFSIISPF